MMNQVHCSTATIAATFDLGEVADLGVAPEPPGDLAPHVRRYRSPRSAVVAQALRASLGRIGPGLPDRDRRGVVLGTATGAGPDIEEFLQESVRLGDHLVNPARFPFTVHNAAAGSAAMAAQCRGPNVVVSSGIGSVWSALAAGVALLHDNSAAVVFVGGFESQRLADGTTGTVAALIAISAEPAALGGNHLAPLTARLHRAGVVPGSATCAGEGPPPGDVGAAGVAALVGFANAFAPEPRRHGEPGGAHEAEVAAR